MADEYLKDYSNISAWGGAFKGFADAWKESQHQNQVDQDRQMKQQEFTAKMKADQTKMDRENAQTALENRKAEQTEKNNALQRRIQLQAMGKDVDENGQIVDTRLSPREQAAERLKAFSAGGRVKSVDQYGNPESYEADPNTPTMVNARTKERSAANALEGRDQKNAMAQDRLDLSHDNLDQRLHERVLTRIASNPIVKQKLNQYQGLDNALSVVANAEHLTPETIAEFQQGIRANMGMKGTGGVEERQETMFKSLGLNAAKFKEFLTGDPATLAKDSMFVKHLQELARIEQSNIKNQYSKALAAASGGHASLYARRPDLKADLEDAINLQQSQFAPAPSPTLAEGPQAAVSPSAPQGLIKPEGEGLLSRIGGKLSSFIGTPATAAPIVAHPQDNAAVEWAKQTLKTNPSEPRALAILKANGQ